MQVKFYAPRLRDRLHLGSRQISIAQYLIMREENFSFRYSAGQLFESKFMRSILSVTGTCQS